MAEETFQELLVGSKPSVEAVADYYRRLDVCEVEVPKLHVPNGFEDNKPDSGDIILHLPDGEKRVVEVKQFLRWTGAVIDKFPHILVDDLSKYEAKEHQPWAYFVVDNGCEYAFWLVVKDQEQFFERHQYVGRVTPLHWTVVAPRHCWKCVKL